MTRRRPGAAAQKAQARATASCVIWRCKSAARVAPSAGMSRVFAWPGFGRRVNTTSERVVAVAMGASAQGSGATAPATSRAGEAMNTRLNLPAFQPRGRQVPKVKRPAFAHLHVEHLVEVTIEDFAHPTDTDGAATHQALDRRWIETVGK